MGRLVVVGSLNADVTITVDHLPSAGETVVGVGAARLGFGGKGGNQACAAAALGADVALVARVGNDDAGRSMVENLAASGVDVAAVRAASDEPTGSAIICVDGGGENLIIVNSGANATLSPAEVAIDAVRNADVLLLQLEVPFATVESATELANGRVILNPAPARPLDAAVLSRIDVLVPNRSELGRLTGGTPPSDLADTARLVHSLPGDFDVIVTLGGDGALVVTRRDGSGRALHLSPPEVDVVDTTGAGDTFCGALAVALSERGDLESAAGFAVAAASLSTTGRGARGMSPNREQVQRALADVSSRAFTP